VAEPQQAQQEILDALYDHFDRSGDSLKPEQVMEMTALDEAATTNALRVLHRMGKIEGVMVAEINHPVLVTGITYE
jgi:predicted transcriptional regulator